MRQLIRDRDFGSFVRRRGAILGFVGFIAVLAAVVYSLQDNAERNHDAIRKGCILLNNAIVESSRATGGKATADLIRVIERLMSPGELRQYKIDARAQGHTTIIKLVRCDVVANHPDRIRAIPAPGTPGY